MTLEQVTAELADKGNPTTKKMFRRHGASQPLFGVRVGDLKPRQKKLKSRQDLAVEL